MLEKIKQTMAININDMVLRAMNPADLIAELITELEQHAVTLRTEAAKAISAENRLKDRIKEGNEDLSSELKETSDLASTQKNLLNDLESTLSDAKKKSEQIASGISLGNAADANIDISTKYKKLGDYLKSL